MNITPVIEAVITLLFAIISCLVIPTLKARLDAEKFAQVAYWVQIAVRAAEQIFSEPSMGQQKKEYVLKFLEEKGLKVDPDSIDALIESYVLEFNKK